MSGTPTACYVKIVVFGNRLSGKLFCRELIASLSIIDKSKVYCEASPLIRKGQGRARPSQVQEFITYAPARPPQVHATASTEATLSIRGVNMLFVTSGRGAPPCRVQQPLGLFFP